ncbi:MAG: EmrB/QacA family drug resistance transporter [Deltaproteobacteria bacterium RBG_13_60_28]|nr:MAG: EmrB/QacA family drug resistance transporter [Deltaproteobacteria bacterium RBG_13_60_28]
MNNQAANGPPKVNKWLITIAVMAGTFMEIVDTTVVNVALPHMAGSLSAGVDEATWVLTSYLVSNAIVLPITGWLSAWFGRKRFLMLCLALFTFSSMLCGSAPTLGTLIFFRIFQGVGGGALQPISQAILLETFPVRERGMAMAIWGLGVVIAPIVGPMLGGWITDNLSWRWAFYINLPIGLISLLMTALFIFDPEYIRKQRAGAIDYWGLGLLIVALGALQVVLDKGEREDWFSSAFIVRLAVISVVALALLIYREMKTEHPVVDLRLFKERNYAAGTTIMFFFGFVLYGSIMLLPLFLQTLMGYDATLAGTSLAWGGVGSLMIMPVVGRLTTVVDSRWLVGIGLVINAVAVYLMSIFNTQIDFATATWPRFIQGFGLGTTFVSLTTLTMSRISQEKMGDATGMFNLMRNLGGSFGIAAATTLLARRGQFHQSHLVERLTPLFQPFNEWMERSGNLLPGLGPDWNLWDSSLPLAALYQEVQRQAQMLAFCDDYWFFTIVFIALLPLVLLMRRLPRAAVGGEMK